VPTQEYLVQIVSGVQKKVKISYQAVLPFVDSEKYIYIIALLL
jgi:hypothetical protein